MTPSGESNASEECARIPRARRHLAFVLSIDREEGEDSPQSRTYGHPLIPSLTLRSFYTLIVIDIHEREVCQRSESPRRSSGTSFYCMVRIGARRINSQLAPMRIANRRIDIAEKFRIPLITQASIRLKKFAKTPPIQAISASPSKRISAKSPIGTNHLPALFNR